MFPYIEVSKMFSVVVLSSFLVGVEGQQQQQPSSNKEWLAGFECALLLLCKKTLRQGENFLSSTTKERPPHSWGSNEFIIIVSLFALRSSRSTAQPPKKNLFMEVEWWREEKKKSTHEFGFLMNSIWNFRCHEANKDKLRRAAQKAERGEVVRVLSSWPVPSSSSSSRNEM